MYIYLYIHLNLILTTQQFFKNTKEVIFMNEHTKVEKFLKVHFKYSRNYI